MEASLQQVIIWSEKGSWCQYLILFTVVKGHMLASACKTLAIKNLDDSIQLPQGIQWTSVQHSSLGQPGSRHNCTLINITGSVDDTEDKVYNYYARVLCHDGSLVLEFRDASSEGDGERIFRCWRFRLPHFKASGKTNTQWKLFDFSCKLKLFCLQCLPTKSFGTDSSLPKFLPPIYTKVYLCTDRLTFLAAGLLYSQI